MRLLNRLADPDEGVVRMHGDDVRAVDVLALRRRDGSFVSNPEPDVTLEPGTTLIAIGTQEQLSALEGLLDGLGDAREGP